MNDHGFGRACPSGNHMCEGNERMDENIFHVGDILKDENGVYWEVSSVDDNIVTVYPDMDQERCYTKQELTDEMEKL